MQQHDLKLMKSFLYGHFIWWKSMADISKSCCCLPQGFLQVNIDCVPLIFYWLIRKCLNEVTEEGCQFSIKAKFTILSQVPVPFCICRASTSPLSFSKESNQPFILSKHSPWLLISESFGARPFSSFRGEHVNQANQRVLFPFP